MVAKNPWRLGQSRPHDTRTASMYGSKPAANDSVPGLKRLTAMAAKAFDAARYATAQRRAAIKDEALSDPVTQAELSFYEDPKMAALQGVDTQLIKGGNGQFAGSGPKAEL